MKYLKPYIRKFAMESVLAPLFKMLEAFFDLLKEAERDIMRRMLEVEPIFKEVEE